VSQRIQVRAKFTVTAGRRGGALIKGDLYDQPEPDSFPGFSASGQDVWVPEAHYDEPGIVVSAVGARCGKAFKADGRWTAIANTHVLLPRSGFDRNLLWWIFNDESFWIRGGSAQPYVQFEASLEQLITLPQSLNAQHAIAAFLDRQTARIDALVAAKQRLLDLLADKRKAIIAAAVTRGLDPKVKLRDSGVPWLGEIPAHWEHRNLRFCCTSIQTGGTPAPEFLDYEGEDGLDWLTPGDFGESLVPERSSRRVAPGALSAGDLKMFPSGAVLVVGIGATLGKVALLKQVASANQQVNALTPREDVDGAYLAYEMSVFSDLLRVSANTATLPILNQQRMGDVTVLVPPLAEQQAIVQHIARETAKLDAVRTATERTIALLKERRSALIAAAVTGQLDVEAAA
jgi:type I restriction enzyme S subunit